MARPLSELLEILTGHAELKSSYFNALNALHDLGEFSSEEHVLAQRALDKMFAKMVDNGGLIPFTARKEAVKQLVKECKKNESMPNRF